MNNYTYFFIFFSLWYIHTDIYIYLWFSFKKLILGYAEIFWTWIKIIRTIIQYLIALKRLLSFKLCVFWTRTGYAFGDYIAIVVNLLTFCKGISGTICFTLNKIKDSGTNLKRNLKFWIAAKNYFKKCKIYAHKICMFHQFRINLKWHLSQIWDSAKILQFNRCSKYSNNRDIKGERWHIDAQYTGCFKFEDNHGKRLVDI